MGLVGTTIRHDRRDPEKGRRDRFKLALSGGRVRLHRHLAGRLPQEPLHPPGGSPDQALRGRDHLERQWVFTIKARSERIFEQDSSDPAGSRGDPLARNREPRRPVQG